MLGLILFSPVPRRTILIYPARITIHFLCYFIFVVQFSWSLLIGFHQLHVHYNPEYSSEWDIIDSYMGRGNHVNFGNHSFPIEFTVRYIDMKSGIRNIHEKIFAQTVLFTCIYKKIICNFHTTLRHDIIYFTLHNCPSSESDVKKIGFESIIAILLSY